MDVRNKKTLIMMFFFPCVFLMSCNKTERRLMSYLRAVNPSQQKEVTIDLRKAMKVDYDCAYLFFECTTERDIEAVLGIPYRKKTFLPDSKQKLILMKDKKIVYDDDFYDNNVGFFFYSRKYHYQTEDVSYLTWHDSIFVATLKDNGYGGLFYQLWPIAD